MTGTQISVIEYTYAVLWLGVHRSLFLNVTLPIHSPIPRRIVGDFSQANLPPPHCHVHTEANHPDLE